MSSSNSSPTRFSILFAAFPPSTIRLGMFVVAIVSHLGRSMILLSAALLGYAAARESDQAMEDLLFAEAHHWLVG